MPRIFDNIEKSLLPTLQETLELSNHADFCVGFFNLRGWKGLDSYIDKWSGGDGHCCRLLVGMQRLPQDELRQVMRLTKKDGGLDNQTALRLKKKLAEEFREQLTVGAPTNEDEVGLRQLAAQIKAKKVIVKLFLRHPLHAKLYLLFRPDPVNPFTGYLGSSNLTFSGLSSQGELNVDVLDHDACKKLAKWFEDRWNDRWCIDISDELVRIIEESWAREEPIPPFHIYIKMAYHLSQEARAGLSEFRIPREFGQKLFEFQQAAVKIAAHHINKRGGVLIGDVVGLGKSRRVLNAYPHELSGGMKQRAMIAMAICCNPSLLIADEPTTALDVTLQLQILKLIRNLKAAFSMGILFISHNLGVVREIADRISVIYAGKIVESASNKALFENTLHPYTKALLQSIPDADKRGQRLQAIPGSVPDAENIPKGCSFHPRCTLAGDICGREIPMTRDYGNGHAAACHMI